MTGAEQARALYVYWCPICEIQTERPWHIYRRGDPLIPQNDGEHYCERVEVVRAAALSAAEAELHDAREALARAAYVSRNLLEMIPLQTWRDGGGDDGQGHYEGDYRQARIADEIYGWSVLARAGEAEDER